MVYTVYQLPIEDDLIFMDKDFAEKKLGRKISVKEDLQRYKEVYRGRIFSEERTDIILDEIFYKLNVEHPEDYKARSLSVSDIVLFEDEYYFCENIGWTKLD